MAKKAKCQFCDFILGEEDFYCPACGEPVADYGNSCAPQKASKSR